jgi:hypothetical protein
VIKEYKEETFLLAVSIMDRYLVHMAVLAIQAPPLEQIATACILLAAKLEQPVSPSFIRMVRLVKQEFDIEVEKQTLISIEEAILRVLDFNLQ